MSDFISTPRLDSYKNILKIHDSDEIMRAYCWSIAVSAALYPVIQTLEITLRNALDIAVKNNHVALLSSGKPSYRGNPLWFKLMIIEKQNSLINKMNASQKSRWVDPTTNRRKKHSSSEEQIQKIERDLSVFKPYVQPEDILSNLSFGFWTTLLSKKYEDVTNKHLLWPNLLRNVFPNAPYGYTRKDIESDFNLIREFRNRFAHHEPVWKFFDRKLDNSIDYTKPIHGLHASLNLLNKQYDQMLDVIKWMSLDTYNSFILSNMHVEFKKLCSLDGFYAYVNKEKISNKKPRSRAKRDIFKLIDSYKNDQILYVKTHKKRGFILGINEPEF